MWVAWTVVMTVVDLVVVSVVGLVAEKDNGKVVDSAGELVDALDVSMADARVARWVDW